MLVEEILCLLERDLVPPATEAGTEGAVTMGGVSGFGVSTTRRIRGWRVAGESERRDAMVCGVSGRDPITETEPGGGACSVLTDRGSGEPKSSGLPLVVAELGCDWCVAFAGESLKSAPILNSLLRWVRALLADFCTGDPKEIWEASFTRLDVKGPPTVSSGLKRREGLSIRLCEGLFSREMVGVNPGGRIGAGDEGLEELCSWKIEDEG